MMYKQGYLLVTTSIILVFHSNECAYFSDVHWSTAITLSEYEGYRSVSLLSYNIPEQSVQVSFSFQAKTSGKECSFKKVHVYLQHGSYPLVTLYNESYPEQFYVNRLDEFHVEIEKDAEAVSYFMSTPQPGTWYMAAFLPKPHTDQINQKGLKKSCLYGMFVVVNSQGVDNVEEISLQQKHKIHLTQTVGDHQALYRYVIPQDTVEYNIKVEDCLMTPYSYNEEIIDDNITDSNITTYFTNTTVTTKLPEPTTLKPVTSTKCPIIIRIQAEKLPALATTSNVSCGNLSTCQLQITSPVLDKWSYILIEIDNQYNVSEVSFKLAFNLKECHSFRLMIPRTIFLATNGNQDPSNNSSLEVSQDSCIKMDSLGRFVWDRNTFNVSYLWAGPGVIPIPETLESMPIPDYQVLVTNMLVEAITDIGGTLRVSANLIKTSVDTGSHHVVIYICLMKNRIPGGVTIQSCDNSIQMLLNSSSEKYNDEIYIPYPEPGNWYLALRSQCSHPESRKSIRCKGLPLLDMDISISGCVKGQCGEYGECRDYISGVHVFSSCYCYAGWKGYGCTDGTEGRSKSDELFALLLLTLSNLFFIPSICLAIYRRYFVEAAIYLYTMFFSAFYHACDTSDLVYYCLLHYDTLSFADFLGSISSFWVTMLAMSDIPKPFRSFAQTLGAIGVSVGVEYDRHGLWVFAIPAGIAAVIMFCSWIIQCKKRKRLFPGKMYFLCNFLPGVLLAATGLVLFAFFETDTNYKYTHSGWHIAMSLSIVFLLPRKQEKGINLETNNDSASTNTNSTVNNSRIILNSYTTNVSNGSVTVDMGDNPAFAGPI